MADHHHNQRPHHPLWGNVNSPRNTILTILIVLFVIAMFNQDIVTTVLQNAFGAFAQALMPFINFGVMALVIILGIRMILFGGRRH